MTEEETHTERYYTNRSNEPETFTDKTPMPWGKHKGVEMANVDAGYLIWIRENLSLSPRLRKYIDDNRQLLDREVRTSTPRRKDDPVEKELRDAYLSRFDGRK